MMSWEFFLNNAPMSTFKSASLTVSAFSGTGEDVNQCAAICAPNQGPIPTGRYYIVDRESGGTLGGLRDWISGKDEWFALYADDGSVDDYTLCEEVRRGNFRLHPKGPRGLSLGCITIDRQGDFDKVRKALLATETGLIPGSEMKTYGTVTVTCSET